METERLAITEPILLIGLFIVCALIVYYGRLEIAAGIYTATQRWAYSVDVGPTTWVWVWVITLIAASIIFFLRRSSVGRSRARVIPKTANLVVYLLVWVGWMLIRWYTLPSSYATQLMKNLIIYDLVSFVVISMFSSDLSRVRVFALTFVGATVVSGLISLSSSTDLTYQIQTSVFLLRGFDAVNYLAFAVPFAIATIWSLVFVGQTSHWFYRLLGIGAIAFCVFCLLLTGARQSIVAVIVAWAVFIPWALRRKRFSRRTAIVAVVLSGLVGILLYSQSTLLSRWVGPEANLEDLGGRFEIWQAAWEVFLTSPLWGAGFDYFKAGYGAHNLWLDVMAAQGLVGFVFLNVFLILVFRFARDRWTVSGNSDLAVWRMGALCALIYALVQAIPAGTIGGSVSHLFWISAIVWRLSVAAQRENVNIGPDTAPSLPAKTLTNMYAGGGYLQR